jgi:hypothetical protein
MDKEALVHNTLDDILRERISWEEGLALMYDEGVKSVSNEPRERREQPNRLSDIARTANNVFDKSEGANGRGPHWF